MSPTAEPRLRAGVVGAGHMGQYHIIALMELWDVDLVGIVDQDFSRAEALASTYGTKAFHDHRELAGLVDVATVAVPTEQHFDVSRDLLEAGVHVLVEKPMTPTLEEAKELASRPRAELRRDPDVQKIARAVPWPPRVAPCVWALAVPRSSSRGNAR